MTTININDYVCIRLTPEGRARWNGCCDERGDDPRLPADGRVRLQLWEVMQLFGPMLWNGCEMPFECDIEIADT